MKYIVLTAFPDIFESPLNETILKRAQEKELVEIEMVPLRDFADGKHLHLDDYPYGGGAGMVLMAEPICKAFESLDINRESKRVRTLFMSPQGKRLDQAKLKKLSQYETLVILCGRYKGVDQRVIDMLIDEEVSVGDYVLSGGEIPALVIIDGVSRLIDGVLGNAESAATDTFHAQLLDCPVFTRPATWRGISVPDVLVGGNHKDIAKWRNEMSMKTTAHVRNDLYVKFLESTEGKSNE